MEGDRVAKEATGVHRLLHHQESGVQVEGEGDPAASRYHQGQGAEHPARGAGHAAGAGAHGCGPGRTGPGEIARRLSTGSDERFTCSRRRQRTPEPAERLHRESDNFFFFFALVRVTFTSARGAPPIRFPDPWVYSHVGPVDRSPFPAPGTPHPRWSRPRPLGGVSSLDLG